MVNLRLGETARLTFFSASLRLFDCLETEIETPRSRWLHKKLRLRNVQNRYKNKIARPVKFD